MQGFCGLRFNTKCMGFRSGVLLSGFCTSFVFLFLDLCGLEGLGFRARRLGCILV